MDREFSFFNPLNLCTAGGFFSWSNKGPKVLRTLGPTGTALRLRALSQTAYVEPVSLFYGEVKQDLSPPCTRAGA
jgi:hypothetical protein